MQLQTRALQLFAMVLVGTIGGCGCEDGNGFGTLSVAVEASPTSVTVTPLWAGSLRTRTVELRNIGTAAATLSTPRVVAPSGPATVNATLPSLRVAPGAVVMLSLDMIADANGDGEYTSSVVIDVDGAESVTVRITLDVAPEPPCDDGNSCTVNTFDVATGACTSTPLADFSPCDDASACTAGDLCLTGRCVGNILNCDDNVPCTIDGCDAATGCFNEPSPSRCSDDNNCTQDLCTPGWGCENPPVLETTLCHYDECVDIGFCAGPACIIQPIFDGVPCEDGDACTLEDTCRAGECTPGARGEPGAAPPVMLTNGTPLLVDDCLHPHVNACRPPVPAAPASVLAVERAGPLSAVVFRTEFVDDDGFACDPASNRDRALVAQIVVDAGAADEPPGPPRTLPDGGAVAPPDPLLPSCTAGIFVAAYAPALPPPLNIPETRIVAPLTTVYGPVGASFGRFDLLSRSTELFIAHYDFGAPGSIWLQTLDLAIDPIGVTGSTERLQWPELPNQYPLDILVAQSRQNDPVVVGVPDVRSMCIVGCDALAFGETQLPVWSAPAGDPLAENLVGALRVRDRSTCGNATPPFDFVNGSLSLRAASSGRTAVLSFVASEDACNPRPRAWSVEFDVENVPTDVFEPLPYLPNVFDGGTLVEDVDGGTGGDGGADVLDGGVVVPVPFPVYTSTHVEHGAPDAPVVLVEAIDCAEGPLGCRRVVLQSPTSRQNIADAIGTTSVAAAPLGVNATPRTAVFIGPRAEMRWFDEEQSLRRLPAPPLNGFSYRGDQVGFVRGESGESLAAIGHGVVEVCDQDGEDCISDFDDRRAVVLQQFTCGYGRGEDVDGILCESAQMCGEGQGCDFEQGCQPPPDCLAGPCLAACWGVCAVPEGPCASRALQMCAADGACRVIEGLSLCVPAEDCTPLSCPQSEVCVEVQGDCAGADAGCPSAFICLPDVDAGPDGGAFDGGAFDGGAFDGGAFDGGAFDGGAFDGGAFDGGRADGGISDAGVSDAG